MKKINLLMTLILGIAFLAPVFTSCSKDEEKAKAPEALFSFVASGDGRTITFTNESTDATTFEWNFGDGETSTVENPVHVFPTLGQYTVVLTAKGPGGEDVFSYDLTVTKASVIKLDDASVADWATIADAFVAVDNNGGLIKKVKLDYDGDYIYFYMEAQDQISDSLVTGVHFDLDNDSTTGFNPWTNTNIGSDMYYEGLITTGGGWGSLFEFPATAGQTDWAWEEVTPTDYIVYGTHVQDGSILKVEWAFNKSKLTTTTQKSVGDKITIIINHYLNWEPSGFFPALSSPAYVLNMH